MKLSEAAIIVGSILLFVVMRGAHGPARSEWRIERSSDASGVELRVDRVSGNGHWSWGSRVPWSSIRGLTPEQLNSSSRVKFEMARDAGTLVCEGSVRYGSGSGSYTFRPNPDYTAELQRLGYGAPREDDLMSMALIDVSLAFARGVHDAGVRATTGELAELRIHGIDLDYIRGVREAEYDFTAPELVQLKIHGVPTDFLRDLKAAGYDCRAEQIVQLRIHGVGTELVRELKAAGYDLAPDEVVQLNIHGVKPVYIRQLKDYDLKPSATDLVQMKIHGVEADYLKALKDAGYGTLLTQEVVQLKIHGVPPDFIRDAKAMGFDFTPKELTDLHVQGVNSSYLRKLKESGFRNLSAGQIVKLKVHGID